MYAPYAVIKNAPYPLYRIDSGTTLNLSKDGGTLGAAAATPVETPAASGIYYNVLTTAEMSGDIIVYKGTTGDSRSDGVLIPEPCFDSGVAQAATSTTLTLRAGAPSNDLAGSIVEIVRGTGSGQRPRLITNYDTFGKVATVRPNWSTTPDNTSIYKVTFLEQSNMMTMDGSNYAPATISEFWTASIKSTAVNSGSTTALIKTSLTGMGVNQLVGCVLQCMSSNNYGICRPIIAYNNDTGDITVNPPFALAPAMGDTVHIFGTTG